MHCDIFMQAVMHTLIYIFVMGFIYLNPMHSIFNHFRITSATQVACEPSVGGDLCNFALPCLVLDDQIAVASMGHMVCAGRPM